MIKVIVCERGKLLDGKQLHELVHKNLGGVPVLDLVTLKRDSAPTDMKIGDWFLLLGELFTVARRIIEPEERGGVSDYDVYYLVWPLSKQEKEE